MKLNNLTKGMLLAIMLSPVSAMAEDSSKALASFAKLNILPWLQDPLILGEVRKQNEVSKDFSEAEIIALDEKWRAVAEAGTDPLIKKVTSGKLADFLRKKNEGSGGAIAEVIVMDAKGLNVAATQAPSDFWQGDEPKFQNSAGKGPEGVDFGAAERDDSTGDYIAQVSYPIVDPETREVIGAVTVGVRTAALD
jgi:hypothetical protein